MNSSSNGKLLRGLALAIVNTALSTQIIAQMAGPHATSIDPMHTTQPICDGDKNDGLDIAVPIGTPVLAPAPGAIMAVWNDKTYGCGLTVMIKFPDSSIAGLSWLSDTMVYVGENVKQLQIVGHSGQSGNATSPHLHYTLFTTEEGKVDPRKPRQQEPSERKTQLADPADLKKVMDQIDGLDESAHVKAGARKYAIERFQQEQTMAGALYKDRLKKATNYWYASNKN